MKKFSLLLLLGFFIFSCEKPMIDSMDLEPMLKAAKVKCTTIQSGTLVDSKGNVIKVGYDKWGYNYQANMFNGLYDNFSKPDLVATTGDKLIMKWNNAWLSSTDCDGDGKLDRHFGYASYLGSGAWLTNHVNGSYTASNGKKCQWTYFVKIVAAPADAVLTDGIWYTTAGVDIGYQIWNEFAVIQEIWNDPCAGLNGVYYKGKLKAGLGNW